MPEKTLLQTVVDSLDRALTLLRQHPNFVKDLAEIENGIKEEKEKIEMYKKAKEDEPYSSNDIPWGKVKEKKYD